jgi:predicted naringenin-chalcone synthase
MANVYIADICEVLPTTYDSTFAAGKLYPVEKYGPKINRKAALLSKRFGVKDRLMCIDLDVFPEIRLKTPEDHPVAWGSQIVESLTRTIPKESIGYLTVNYNTSTHKDVLPNVAVQIAQRASLERLDDCQELAHYGCASGVYSLKAATEYVETHDRPAIVFSYDHCSSYFKMVDAQADDFNPLMITNLLFSDAGVGLLLIPERLKEQFDRPVLRINEIKTKFISGDLVKMTDEKFLMSADLKNVMPNLVSDEVVKPFLNAKKLMPSDISEWAIHQGGKEVLNKFGLCECLGLSDEQLSPSLNTFLKYGNTSSASCLLTLKHFFDRASTSRQGEGLVVGFGAGYYMGLLHYSWQ